MNVCDMKVLMMCGAITSLKIIFSNNISGLGCKGKTMCRH